MDLGNYMYITCMYYKHCLIQLFVLKENDTYRIE